MVELDREKDGRVIAAVPELPGVLAYGNKPDQALARAQALALRVIADRVELAEIPADCLEVRFHVDSAVDTQKHKV